MFLFSNREFLYKLLQRQYSSENFLDDFLEGVVVTYRNDSHSFRWPVRRVSCFCISRAGVLHVIVCCTV